MNIEQLEKQLWIMHNETIPRLTKRINELEQHNEVLESVGINYQHQTPSAPEGKSYTIDFNDFVVPNFVVPNASFAKVKLVETAPTGIAVKTVIGIDPAQDQTVSLTDLVNYREALFREMARNRGKQLGEGLAAALQTFDNAFPELARGGGK